MTKKEEKEPKKPQQRVLKMGHKLPDGLVLQRDTVVEYEQDGDKRVVTGPENLRPAILLGTTF